MTLITLIALSEFIMSGLSDRHRGARAYASGATKRKHAKEKKDKEAKELAKMSRMTDFIMSDKDTKKTMRNTESKQENTGVVETIPDEKGVKSEQNNDIHYPGTSTSTVVYTQEDDEEPVPSQRTGDLQDTLNSTGIDNDIGKWPDHLSKAVVEYWIRKGPKELQHCDAKLIEEKSFQQRCENNSYNRKCTLSMF